MSISIEELILLAGKSDGKKREATVKYVNLVHRFIAVFKIKTGKNPVKPKVIIDVYRQWNLVPISDDLIIKQFNQFFTPTKIKGELHYKINQDPLTLIKKASKIKVQ